MTRSRLAVLLGLLFVALALPSSILVYQAYGQLKWEAFYQHQLAVIDATTITARYLQRFLACHQLLSTHLQTEDHFMVSALTEDFEKATRIFFGHEVHLEQLSV